MGCARISLRMAASSFATATVGQLLELRNEIGLHVLWDNPGGQLPGTGIRGDGENLHDGRSTQRVRGSPQPLWLKAVSVQTLVFFFSCIAGQVRDMVGQQLE